MANYSGVINPIETISGDIGETLSIGGELSNQMADVTGDVSVPRGLGELPIATDTTLGGIVVGDDLLITAEGRLSVDKATSVEGDNTRPITAAAVYTEIGNINVLLATI